jgi:hypothetical protein
MQIIDKSRFKNSMGQWYLNALFFEQIGADKSTVVYTLKDEDHEGFPSLYKLYMDMEDVLEYEFANTHLGSWSHWETLTQCTWFKPYIQRWRKELQLKIQSKALRMLRKDAESDSKTSNSSNRYLLERGWREKNTKGRPSKEDVKRAAKEQAEATAVINEDFLRITQTSPVGVSNLGRKQ